MLNTNFSPWPSYTKEEADAVSAVLLSNKVNYWTGNKCREFELEFSNWCGVKYAVALANGTLALENAFRAMELSYGDEVIVTSRTYIASVSSIINAGAVPVFADIDLDSQNISPDSILKHITNNSKAILCVHLAGWPCEMDKIMEIAYENNLFVIEDCSQAHGAKYKGKSVGSIGDIGCWSFCQDKIISTGGEGGMVTTNNESLWKKMWAYKDHGKNYELAHQKMSSNSFRYIHETFGTNWRMTEMQAVIGQIQLRRMSEWQDKRIKNAEKIWKTAKQFKGLRVPIVHSYIEHAAYKCYVFVDINFLKTDWSRERIIEEINMLGVPCYLGSCSEVFLEKSFDKTGFKPQYKLPNASRLGKESIMFLVHPTLTDAEIKKTCNIISEVMIIASK